jgi:hypothetical protein
MTNQRIEERFAKLAHTQIQKSCQWIQARVPPTTVLDGLQKLADEMSEHIEKENGADR